MYTQFASVGAKILGQMIHPIFRIDNEFPCSNIILVVSKEDKSDPMTLETQENISEIQSGEAIPELSIKIKHGRL